MVGDVPLRIFGLASVRESAELLRFAKPFDDSVTTFCSDHFLFQLLFFCWIGSTHEFTSAGVTGSLQIERSCFGRFLRYIQITHILQKVCALVLWCTKITQIWSSNLIQNPTQIDQVHEIF